MILRIDNPSLEGEERTVLTDPVNSAATNLPVKSSQEVTATEYIFVGEPGKEKTELTSVTAVVDVLNLTVPALSYSHSEGDAVITSRWNKIKIYRATSLTGTYTEIGASPIDLDPDNPDNTTNYEDTAGLATDYYKISYYNSTTTVESDKSDPIPGSGITRKTVRYITDQILKEANDLGESITSREEILDWMNECSADVKARRRKWDFLSTRAAASTIANQEYYNISTSFGVSDIDKIDHIEYNYTENSADLMYRLRYVPNEEFDMLHQDRTLDGSDDLERWTFDEAMDYIRIYPVPATSNPAALYLYYYKDIPYLDSDGDEVVVPEPRLYKYYCLGQFYLKKNEAGLSDRYLTKYEQTISNMSRTQRREVGQPRGFRYNPKGLRGYFKS